MKCMDALRSFGIASLKGQDTDTLRRLYRDKMKECHPDHGGSDTDAQNINEAYEVLKKELEEIKLHQNIELDGKIYNVLIDFDTLNKILNDREYSFIYIAQDGNEIKLNYKSIRKHEVYIEVPIELVKNGNCRKDNRIFKADMVQLRSIINCNVIQEYDTDSVIIMIGGKTVKLNLRQRTTNLTLKFGVFQLDIIFERVEAKD